MEKSCQISIITPSLNQGQFIERTIKSVLSQNIPNLEYVVVDGQSSDNTVEILKQYEKQLRWVSEADKGQADAVNKGINMTSGEIIGWLNSDDIYYPNAITTICDYFKAHPEVDVIYGKANHIAKDDKILKPYNVSSWSIKKLAKLCYISQPAVFFRRKVVEKFGGLDISLTYCMDYEYWLRLALAGVKFTYLPKLLAGSRHYLETKTSGSPVAAHKESIEMLQKKLTKVPSRWFISYAYAVEKKKQQYPIKSLRFVLQVLKTALHTAPSWQEKLSIIFNYPWIVLATFIDHS